MFSRAIVTTRYNSLEEWSSSWNRGVEWKLERVSGGVLRVNNTKLLPGTKALVADPCGTCTAATILVLQPFSNLLKPTPP